MAYDFGLRERRAFITGAASGIGRATALTFAAMGCRVAVADIRIEPLQGLLSELPGSAGEHVSIPFDLADGTACEAAVRLAAERLGGFDYMVHAGAMLRRQGLTDVTAETLQQTTAVNMWGSFFIARAAADLMAGTGGGSIILFSSQGAYTGGFAGSAIYSMTKAAVAALIKTLAREYAPHRVRVNGIAPGAIETPMMTRSGMTADALARFVEMIPLGRMGSPDEVAQCCAFLASSASEYITGQMLHVNGGQLMQ